MKKEKKESIPMEKKHIAGVWDQIDGIHDTIIEASAGTGKTFALQQIVLKLVQEGKVVKSPKEILLVTFTEKAAGELRDRIRTILSEHDLLPPDFDEMTISTIHSFCQKLLSEYAFENGVPMSRSVVGSDDDLKRKAVLTSLHSEAFKKECGEHFTEWMDQAGYDSAERLISYVQSQMKSPIDLQKYLDDEFQNLRDATEQNENPWKWLLGNAEFESEDTPVYRMLVTFSTHYPEILQIGSQPYRDALSLTGFDWKIRYKMETGRFKQFERNLPAFVNFWNAFRRSASCFLRDPLLKLAKAEFHRLKEASGTMTFDDLVRQASDVIEHEPEDSTLLKKIRERYPVAMVDEFQDTDLQQWTIFKNLFSHQNNPNGFLLVVGDPKQAIYSFRGADIGTYLKARNEITDGFKDARKTLTETYRSTRPLVACFNDLFSTPDWFGDMAVEGNKITYENVSYPKGGNLKYDSIIKDWTGRGALTLLEALPDWIQPGKRGGFGNKTNCLPHFVRNAIFEIERLRSLTPAFEYETAGEPPPRTTFRYGDFCFLVRANSEASMIRQELIRYGIPFCQYKEAGLYNSPEAESILAMFDFLAEPNRIGRLAAVLQTPFYGVSLTRVEDALETIGQEFYQQIDRWEALVRSCNWNRLFDSLMNDTLIAHPMLYDYEFDRRWAAMRQILDTLLTNLGRSAVQITEFSNLLRQWRDDDRRAGEGVALRQLESEEDRVQIMTMHACKGLQFPVVFLPYGFSPMEEDGNELRRLIYVSITRARHKVYLPWSRKTNEQGIGSKGSALRGGFLGNAICSYFKKQPPRQNQDQSKDPWNELFQSVVVDYQGEELSSEVRTGADRLEDLVVPVQIPEITFPQRDHLHWDSFSSLNRHGHEAPILLEDETENDEITDESSEAAKPVGTLLPRSALSGTVFHEVMEALCKGGTDGAVGFEVGREPLEDVLREGSSLRELVAQKMRANALFNQERENDSTERTLARMAWVALNTEIRIGEKRIFLKNIPPEDRRAEVGFVLSERAVYGNYLYMRDGTFNGSIDLLFRPDGVDGPVYILDWKTNFLQEGYGEESVREAMESAGYLLQFQLYSLAAGEWLGKEKLGGVAYLFVRGGEHGNKSGTYTEEVKPGYFHYCFDEVLKVVKGTVKHD